MPTALEIVRKLTDSEVMNVSREVFNAVYAAVPYKEVRNNSESIAELGPLVSLDGSKLKSDLPAAESARLGRIVLEQYAGDPRLAPFVEQAWAKAQRSDKLVIVEVLTLGLLVNLTLLVATTEIHAEKGKDGKTTWKVTKKKAEPKLVKAVIEPVVAAAKAIL